jgi:hypothetical protein
MIISENNPTRESNPNSITDLWVNMITGEMFICVQAKFNGNRWIGYRGTTIYPYGLPDPTILYQNTPSYTDFPACCIIDGDLFTFSTSDNTLRKYNGVSLSSLDYSVVQPNSKGFICMDYKDGVLYAVDAASDGWAGLYSIDLVTAAETVIISQIHEYKPIDMTFVNGTLYITDNNGGKLGKYVDLAYDSTIDISSNLGYANLLGATFDGKNVLLSFYEDHMVAMRPENLTGTKREIVSGFSLWHKTLCMSGDNLCGYDDSTFYEYKNSAED